MTTTRPFSSPGCNVLDGAELDIGDVVPPKLEEQHVDHLEVSTYPVLAEGLGDVVNENGEDSPGENAEIEDCIEDFEGPSAETRG